VWQWNPACEIFWTFGKVLRVMMPSYHCCSRSNGGIATSFGSPPSGEIVTSSCLCQLSRKVSLRIPASKAISIDNHGLAICLIDNEISIDDSFFREEQEIANLQLLLSVL